MQKVHLTRTKRITAGHLWVFSNELHENPKQYVPGSLVEIYDMKENFLGVGYINPKSLISVRILSREKVSVDSTFLRGRIEEAIGLRKNLFGMEDSYRVIFSEGDYLPGLIVDKYGSCLVIQFLTLGMELLKDVIIEILDGMLNPDLIVLRNDSRVRDLEGMPRYKEVVKGTLETLPRIHENGVTFEIDPLEGQKTGFFLDQRENRNYLSELVKEGRGLDLFCYSGAWTLRLAYSGAEVTGVDESSRAIQWAERNAGLNGLQEKVKFVTEDVFSFLKRELGRNEGKYDFIVLDPPAFVKSSTKLKEAVKAYRSLNEMSMRLLKPGGILATSSCSYHLGRDLFLDMLGNTGKNAHRNLRMIALRSQGRDHPVVLAMPETEYLKCAFLLVD
jgi:23S rRNA (cytosine1962-C5)-methyltransferase